MFALFHCLYELFFSKFDCDVGKIIRHLINTSLRFSTIVTLGSQLQFTTYIAHPLEAIAITSALGRVPQPVECFEIPSSVK